MDNHVDDPRVQYITASCLDINRVWDRRRLPSPDVTFHLGEYSRIVQSFGDFDDVWEFNIRGTKEVVTFCHERSSLLLYAGSSSKFSSEGAEHLSPYSWTKAKNIEFIRNFSSWFGLDYVITYFYNVYGPGQIGKGPYATVIGIFEEQAANGVPLTVVEPGTQTRDFTHVDDIVDGLILCYLPRAGRRLRARHLAGLADHRGGAAVQRRHRDDPRPPRRAHARQGGHDQGTLHRLRAEAVPG